MTAIGTRQSPVHPIALLAFGFAVTAISLALYGSVIAENQFAGSPLNVARGGGAALASEGGLIPVVAFVVPFVIGLMAAFTGAAAMRRIEQAGGEYRGDAVSVFAILLGGFAAVIGGCMMLAVFLWPHLPSLYTS